MKKVLSFISILIVAFSAVIFTSCAQPYEKVFLEVYDTQGNKLNLDENYNYILDSNDENTFSLTVKVYGLDDETANITFTRKSTTSAFDISSAKTVPVVNNEASVTIKGDHAGSGLLYARIVESNVVKEVEIPIKIVKKLTAIEPNPEYHTAVMVGNSIKLTGDELVYTPFGTNQTEVTYSLKNNVSDKIRLNSDTAVLTVDNDYNLASGREIVVTATAKADSSISTGFVVNIVEGLSVSDVEVRFDQNDASLSIENIDGVATPVVTLVKGASQALYKSTTLAVSVASHYPIDYQDGLAITAYTSNGQVANVSRIDYDDTRARFLITSDLLAEEATISFKVTFAKFKNLELVVKDVLVRVIDLPTDLLVNDISYKEVSNFNFDVYTEYGEGTNGLALDFATSYNVPSQYQQVFLEFVDKQDSTLTSLLQVSYVDQYGVVKQLTAVDGRYALPIGRTIYISLNPNHSANFANYMESGIKMNAWLYKTIDRFNGADVVRNDADKIIAPITLNVKYGITGINAYVESVGSNDYSAINGNIKLIANDIVGGAPSKVVLLDFTPTGLADVNKNISITSSDVSVVKFVIGGNTYTEITGNQLVVLNADIAGEDELKMCYSLVIKGFGKGTADIVITTGNGITKSIGIETVASTNALTLTEKSASGNIKYFTTQTTTTGTFSISQYNDVVIPLGSPINLHVVGSHASSDISIANEEILTASSEIELSNDKVVSLYVVGNQIFINALQTGTNKISLAVYCYTTNGEYTSYNISFYVYVYIPVSQFALSTYGETLYQNTGYYERDMAELELNTIFNKQTATESITLLSTNTVIDVFTIERTINPSLFEGNYYSVAELTAAENYNINLRLTDKEISATSTVVTVELKEFGVVVSSPRCNISIEQMVKVDKVVVSNVSKKSGAYVVKLDIRNGYYDVNSGKTLAEYIANADNNFKQVLTSISNVETATIADLEYKIVGYVDDEGTLRKGTDGSVRVHQDGNNFYIVPVSGGEVVMHIFPHDSYYTAEEYDITKAIEITIQVSDGHKVPFQIGTLSQLLAIGKDAESMGYSYQLSADINLNNKGSYASLPIGKNRAFTGKLTGAYTIARSDGSVLTIQYYLRNAVFSLTADDRYAGLFAINEGELSNIFIENARYNVYAGSEPISLNASGTNNYYLGGVVGQNKGIVENCYVQYLTDELNVNAVNFRLDTNNNRYNLHIGGIVGENLGSIVTTNTMSQGNLLVNISKGAGILGSNTYTYIGGVVGKNSGLISGNYVCQYQQYKLVVSPTEAEYNKGLYYTKSASGYTLATGDYDNNAEYYALVSAPLVANLNVIDDNITSSIDIVVNAHTHNTSIGGIVGDNQGKITNVAYSGDIDASRTIGKVNNDYVGFAGGIAGVNNAGEINSSLTVFTTIKGSDDTLTTTNESVDALDYSMVYGVGVVGGVVGYGVGGKYNLIGAQYMTSVDNLVNRTSIQSYGNIGGLIGQSEGETLGFGYVESFYKEYLPADAGKQYNIMPDIVAVTGDDITTFAGGLIGSANNTTINTSYAKANLFTSASDYAYTGGLVGNATSTKISNAYYKGNIFNAQYDNALVAYGSANIISSYAIGMAFVEQSNNIIALTDPTNLTHVAIMYNTIGNEQELALVDGKYDFTALSNSISTNISTSEGLSYVWYIGDKYNDGHPVQLCNKKVFSTLIPTGMSVELLADSDNIIRKVEANKNSVDKTMVAGYKYDDTTAILFYRTGNQISEFANYIRLEDIISVTVSPTGAEDYVAFGLESGSSARLTTLGGKTCLVLNGIGKVELKVYALYNSSLYTLLTFYVTNGVTEVSLYNSTDTSSRQNLLNNGKTLTLATDSATAFVPVVKFNDVAGDYNVSTAVYLDFNTTNSAYKVVANPQVADRESYYFKDENGEFISAKDHNFDENETYYLPTENVTINGQDATGSFKANENMRIETVSGEQFYDGKAVSNVSVVPYLDLSEISTDFAVGERIDLSTMNVDFSIAVCKRATSVTSNYASRNIRSGDYATINVNLATDFVSSASADLSYETLLNMDNVDNTDALRLEVVPSEQSVEYVESLLDQYGLSDAKDLFNITCYVEANALGIVYKDLRLEMKEEYKYITQDISFSFHFFADSNIDASCDFVLNIAPSIVSKIKLLHYTETTSNTQLGGNTLTNVEQNSATNMIEPGRSGLMVVKVNPVYANVDYFTITSSTIDGYTISFEQMVKKVDASGKVTYTTLFPRPAMPTLDKVSEVDAYGNTTYTGELYVRTLLPTIVAKELRFDVSVNAYVNGVAESIKTSEITLLTSYIPSITMSVDAEDAVAVYDYVAVDDSKLDIDNITIYYILNNNGKYEKATAYITNTTYYTREMYYLIENYTNNITINMEVIGYEFGEPSFSVTPKKDGLTISVPRPAFRLTESGAYVGSSNISVSSVNVGETFSVESEILVTRNGITKKSTDVLKFIIVENLIRPNNVTLDNLTDDNVLSMAMGSSMPLDLRWLTDAGSVDASKEATINDTLYTDIAGSGLDADYEKVLSLFYVKRNTIAGVIKEPLQLGTDSSNVFKINQNIFVDHTGKEIFNGFSLIGTSQTSSTILGFSVYYYYVMTDDGIELNFTNDLSLNQDYILTEINFEFTLLVYFNSTEKEPIPIYTANQFKSYLSSASTESYILMEDITLQDYQPNDAEFVSLDGNGKIIRIINFVPTSPDTESVAQIGLFKEVKTTTLIKNVTLDLAGLKDINVTAYEGYKFGALAVTNSGVITNCDVVSLREADVTAKTKEITISSKSGATTEHLAGFVVDNKGNITNSRLGVAYFDSYRVSVTNNTVITSQTRYFSDDISFNAKGSMAGFVYSNTGVISSSYARGISLNNLSTDMDSAKTAGFVVNNSGSGRIYYSYVRGSGSITSASPRLTSNLIKANGDVAGFVSTNSGYIGDSYANIAVYSVAKFTAGFVGSNASSGKIQRCYSACDIVSNAPSMMPFTGENLLHEIQDASNGGIQDCYYLILSGEYFEAEKDSATGMSLTSFQVASTLNGYAFIESADKTEKSSGVWTYGAENVADNNAIVVDNYKILPDLTGPNIIAKSVRYLETELTDEEGTVTGYVYQYVKDFEYGSEANPYIVRSAKEYNTVFADALTDDASQTVQVLSHVRLVHDIDFMDVGNEVKTRERVIFSGSLDGNGMQINNISITSNTTDNSHDSLGMFSKVVKANTIGASTPVIKNITLNFTKVSGTSMTYVGGLAGIIENSIIINVNLTGGVTVQAYNFGGGLAGLISGNTRIMNINSNLSVSVGKSNHAIDSDGNYMPYVYYSYADYVKMNTYATPALYARYMQQLSYGGGLAGVLDIYSETNIDTIDLTKPNVYLVNINVDASKNTISTLGSNVSVFADVVGGVAGYLGKSTYMASTKYYINSSANSTSYLEGYYIVGGLVGENYGKITVSEAIAQLDSQFTIDSANGDYYRGDSESMAGNITAVKGSYFAGGLIGLNYQGVMEHCDTRLSLYGTRAKFVGGIVGGTLGGAFNTMYTTSIIPLATQEGSYTGGFAGVVFDSSDQKGVLDTSTPLYLGNYIGDYLKLNNITDQDEMEVMLNRVVSSAIYDRTQLAGLNNGLNGALVGYSAMKQDNYTGSQLDSLYTSSDNPTNNYVNNAYVISDGRTATFNIVGTAAKAGVNFDSHVEKFDIGILADVEDVAQQRPEFQKVFGKWNLTYWAALDETKIYPRLLQVGFGSVIEITKASDFQYIYNNPNGNYIITQDINMSGSEYNDCIIGVNFTGSITGYKADGTAPTIYGITLKGSSQGNNCLAFFHETTGATISNINFRYLEFDANVNEKKTGNVAGLIALDNGGTTVSEITMGFSTVITEQATVDGYAYTPTGSGYAITANYATNVGGLVAYSKGTSISNCTSRMDIITDGVSVGGIIGKAEIGESGEGASKQYHIPSVVNSYYYGTIRCDAQSGSPLEYKNIGGVVGSMTGGTVNNSAANLPETTSYSTIICSSYENTTNIGGIVGNLSSTDTHSASVASCNDVGINIVFTQNSSQDEANIGYLVGRADNVSVTSSSVNNHCSIHYAVTSEAQSNPLESFSMGGLIGSANNVTLKDSDARANITNNAGTYTRAKVYNMGQAIGRATGIVNVSGILATGDINIFAERENVISYVGGLVGSYGKVSQTGTTEDTMNLVTSAFFGKITIEHASATMIVGGIAGYAKDTTITNCQSAGELIVLNTAEMGSANFYKLAGIVGQLAGNSSVKTCVMLSYFNVSTDMLSSNILPFAYYDNATDAGIVVSNNIYSADYSFIADSFGDDKNTSLLASEMMGYGLPGFTNKVSKSAVALAMDNSVNSKLVILHGETGNTNTFWKMGGYAGQIGSFEYVMPYLANMETRLSSAGMFDVGTILRPKLIYELTEVVSGQTGVYILVDDANVTTINKLEARIVGCHVTLTINERFANTIAETGAISGVIIGKGTSVNLSNGLSAKDSGGMAGTGLIASVNMGKIFDVTFSDDIAVSGTIPMGVVAYANEGIIYGVGVSADILGTTRAVSGIAYYNSGRIENSYVTADLSGLAMNSSLSAGLVYSNTNNGYISNTYFAGTLTGLEAVNVSAGMTTNNGNVNNVYVDYYAMGKGDNKVTTITTRELQERSLVYTASSDDNFFDDNVWVQQRYLGTNEYIKGRAPYSAPMQDNPMQTLNYGYPLLDLGTKKFNAAGLFEPTYVAKYTGNGTATDPVQIINLGTLDYMRSLGANTHISHFELTRDIYTTHNSGYELTHDWDIVNPVENPSGRYYGEKSFRKVLSGGEITNPRTISGLIGGALLNSIEGGNGNTEEGTGDTITSGIVKNLRMTNSYTETGIVAGTLTTGLVTGVYIEGENQAKAGIVGTMQLGARVNNCLLSGIIESSTNGDVSGVCHQMDSNQDVIANVLLNDLILVGNQNVNGVINTMKAGQVYGMSGRVALQGVSNTNIGGIAGTMSGGTIGISDGEEGLGSTGNQLIIVSQSGAQVGGITRILQDGSIRGNSIQFAFSGTIDTSLVGGLVAEAQKGLVQSNTIYFNMANSSAVQSFGGLVGKAGTGEISVTDNAVSGKAMLSGSVNKVGGLMSTIDQDGMNIIFTSNKITATIQNDATFIDSVGGTGGFFGTIQNSYDFNKTAAEGEETNGNEFTGIVQGVTNVGGQVGYYNAKYDIKSFLVENQVGNVIGSQNVGGVVGYLDLTKTVGATPAVTEDGDVATNAPLTLEGLTNNNSVQAKLLGTVRESKNVGGIFGYINENALYSPTVVTPLTITDMINRGDVASNGESYQTNFVGGIIGKLGAELEYAEDIQASVDVMDVYTYDYTLTNNTNFGSVGGRYFVGGIIGVIASKANRIELASNTNGYDNSSNVRGAGAVGGIAGYLYVPSDQTLEAQEDKLYIRDLVNNSDLNISDRDKASYFGGIVGTIYSTGRVLVSSGIGDEESCNFSGLVNNGSLTGHNYVGGLFGKIVSHSGSVSGFEDINIGDGSTSITGNEYVGGIMGYYKMDKNISLEVFKITNIHNNANITGNKYAGGLFGHLDLTRTYTIPGEQTTEAIYNAGNAKVRTEISNITNNGKVSGIGNSADSGFIGGVIGHLDASKMVVDINNVNNTGSINGYGNYVGGIFGRADLNDETIGFERPAVDEDGNDITEIEEHKTSVKSLTNSGTFGTDAGGTNVSHNMGNYVGGIIGYLQYADATPNDGKTDIVSETIYDVYNAGHVKGNTHVGGIFGYADNFELHGRRAIKDAEGDTTYDKAVYSNTGSVTGVTNVGGIIGSTKYDILGLGEDTKTIELFEKTAVKINADDDYKGALIANYEGIDYTLSDMSGFNVTGNISGNTYAGGLVGIVDNKIIEYIESSANVSHNSGGTAGSYVGGIVGYYRPSKAQRLTFYVTNTIVNSQSAFVGGLVGSYEFTSATKPTIIKNLTYVDGVISGASNTGGLFGRVSSTGTTTLDFGYGNKTGGHIGAENISFDAQGYNRVAKAYVSANGENIGGLFGSLANIDIHHLKLDFDLEKDGVYDITVSASSGINVGGVVGRADNSKIGTASIQNGSGNTAYLSTLRVKALVQGGTNVGGLVGYANDVYSRGFSPQLTISGQTNVGGLAGYSEELIVYYYNIFDLEEDKAENNFVGGANNVGGIVGKATSMVGIYNSIVDYDIQLSGTTSVGGVIGEYNQLPSQNVYGVEGELDIISTNVNSAIAGHENVGGIIGKIVATSFSKIRTSRISVSDNTALGKYAKVSGNNLTTGWAVGYVDGCAIARKSTPFSLNLLNNASDLTEDHIAGTFELPFYVSNGGTLLGGQWHTDYSPYVSWYVNNDTSGKQTKNYSFKRILASQNSPVYEGLRGSNSIEDRTFYSDDLAGQNAFFKYSDAKLSMSVTVSSSTKEQTCSEGFTYKMTTYTVSIKSKTGGGVTSYEYGDTYSALAGTVTHQYRYDPVGEGEVGPWNSNGTPNTSGEGGYTRTHIGDTVTNTINQFDYKINSTYCWYDAVDNKNYLTKGLIMEEFWNEGLITIAGIEGQYVAQWNLSTFDSILGENDSKEIELFSNITEVRRTISITGEEYNLKYVPVG